MGYPAILFLAAVWAIVERMRPPVRIHTPLGLEAAPGDAMTARELEAERETARLLL